MEYENRYFKKNIKLKKVLCINTEILSFNNFPKFIKDFIIEGLFNMEKIIIFTDDIVYEYLEEVLYTYSDLIENSLYNNKLKVKIYNPLQFDFNNQEFLQILNQTAKTRINIRIIWDFKNVAKRYGKLQMLIKCVENIFSYSNNNVKNMFYINNSNYNFDTFKSFCSKFDTIITIDRGKEIFFSNKEQIGKMLWILQSNAKLKYQNSTLVLFNDMFSTIPKTSNNDKFKNIMINKLKDICDVDFCEIYLSRENNFNVIIDSFFGLTKQHIYYNTKDKEVLNYKKNFNKEIISTSKYVLINVNNIKDNKLKEKLNIMGISSCIGVLVEYYDNIKGVIWVGRYFNNKEISDGDVEYIQSICKTAFYLIQEQNIFVELQNKLIVNEKLRAMGEMAAGIAHDMNNILTPIIGCIQLLKDKVKDRSIVKQLKIIEICAYDGINITNKVKNISKNYSNENKDMEIFDIDELLLDAIDLTKNKWLTESALKGINISVVPILNSKAKIKGNSTEIREVFINIIRNAIDAMNEDGIIKITTNNNNNVVNIKIKDNGLGMDEEIKKRIFEPFFTTKGIKGSGLGLSVSYKIIKSHGGSIMVNSKKNIGTCFVIELPICNNFSIIKKDFKEEIIEFEGNILIIDDQQQIRSVVSDMIKSITKCKVKNCPPINIKRELVRRKYDIIICDFSMPEINGLQVAEFVKKYYKDIYFCLMTGWVGNFDKSNIKKIDFILNKPINKEKLKEMFMNYNIK